MKLKKCDSCDSYTLKAICDKCKNKTHDASMKYRDKFVKKVISGNNLKMLDKPGAVSDLVNLIKKSD